MPVTKRYSQDDLMTMKDEIIDDLFARPSNEEDERITRAAKADSDCPPLTEEQVANMRPVAEALPPDLYKRLVSRGKQKAPLKKKTTIRLSPEVLSYFQATGKGWQTRMDEVLKEYVATH